VDIVLLEAFTSKDSGFG